MEVIEAVRKAIQEIVVPELAEIRSEYREIKGILEVTNSRLSDMNAHLIEQSRRIDETNARMDRLYEVVGKMNDSLNARIDEMNKRMDRLYDVIVRREEHIEMKERLIKLENELQGLKSKAAA